MFKDKKERRHHKNFLLKKEDIRRTNYLTEKEDERHRKFLENEDFIDSLQEENDDININDYL